MQNIYLKENKISLLIKVSRIHIFALAAMGTFTFGWLFTGQYPWLLTGVCALDWYIVNLLNKVVDLKEDRINKIPGTKFISLYKNRLITIIITMLFCSLVIVHFFNPFITILRITCHLLGVFYNWPLLPGGRRLKQLYFWKNTASATGFLITLLGYPLAPVLFQHYAVDFQSGISWATVLFTAIFLFLFILSNEIIYDMRDIPGDQIAGLRTYPVVHGETRASQLIDILIIFSVFVLSIGFLFHFLPWRLYVLVVAPVFQFVFYKQAKRHGVSARYCTGMTWIGAIMFLIYHLWILADLPGARL